MLSPSDAANCPPESGKAMHILGSPDFFGARTGDAHCFRPFTPPLLCGAYGRLIDEKSGLGLTPLWRYGRNDWGHTDLACRKSPNASRSAVVVDGSRGPI